MKKYLFIFILLIAVLIFFISCNSESDYIAENREEKQEQNKTIQTTPEKEINIDNTEELSEVDNSFPAACLKQIDMMAFGLKLES